MARALSAHDDDVDQLFATRLRAALLAERVRADYCRRIVVEALSVLVAGGVPATILPGFSLAETLYAEPALRHCHQLNVMILHGDVREAAGLVWPGSTEPTTDATGAVQLKHPSGWPVVFHATPPLVSDADVVADASGLPWITHEVSLAWSLVGAPFPEDFSYSWICDALHIIECGGGVDWLRVIELVEAWNGENEAKRALRFLVNEFGVEAPTWVAERWSETLPLIC